MDIKLAIVGLGYVGLPLAVEFSKIQPVWAFDIDKIRVGEVKSGFDRTRECSESDLKNNKNLILTDDQKQLEDASVYIITVPTPVDNANRPDLEPLKRATRMIGRQLSIGDIVVYESTVFPGATEEICVPLLEQESGLAYNVDFFCGYSPERINPGDKVNTISSVIKVVSGSNAKVAAFVDELYSAIVPAGTWRASSIKIAEASKVIENTQRDLNIAFVNELSLIFDRLGIDTLEVLEAAGSKWNFLPFRPGMVGGHCIGIDPLYLVHKAEEVGYSPELVLASRRINESIAYHAAQSIVKRMLLNGVMVNGSQVGVLGLTFKENCPDIRNSKVFDLIAELTSYGANCIVVDPWADVEEVKEVSDIKLISALPNSICDALVVAVGHSEFRSMSPVDLMKHCKSDTKPVLGDLKSLFDRAECTHEGFDVYRL